MEAHDPRKPLPEPDTGYLKSLALLHVNALRALTQANTALMQAEQRRDSENWAFWRGYRRAVLEVLAITDNLSLPISDALSYSNGS
jgi:hypothetical protein